MGEEIDAGFQKKKKIIMTAIIVSVALLVLIIFLLIFFMIKDANGVKFAINENNYKVTVSTVDGTDIQKGSISYENSNYDIFCVKDGDYYFNINSLADLLDYQYKKGEYDPVSEDSDKCYIINEGEYSSFAYNSNIVKKQFYDSKTSNSSSNSNELVSENIEIFTTDREVIKVDDSLYASAEAIKIGFNVQINTDGKQITLYSLPYLSQQFETYATNKGYDSISSDFKNKRALVNDLVVVKANYLLHSGDKLVVILKQIRDKKYGLIEVKGGII